MTSVCGRLPAVRPHDIAETGDTENAMRQPYWVEPMAMLALRLLRERDVWSADGWLARKRGDGNV